MKLEEAFLHMTRLALQGKTQDCDILARMQLRRERRAGNDVVADELERLIREHSQFHMGFLREAETGK